MQQREVVVRAAIAVPRTVTAVALCCSLVLGACGGTGGPAATAGPPTATGTAPPPAATAAATRTATPTKVPLPTFGAVVEPAAEAPSGAITLEMSYAEDPRYIPNAITAPQGSIVLFLTNTDKVSERHDFNLGPEIGRAQVHVASIGGKTAAVVTLADVPAGTYTFWCTVHDHYKLGMVGTLTVTP